MGAHPLILFEVVPQRVVAGGQFEIESLEPGRQRAIRLLERAGGLIKTVESLLQEVRLVALGLVALGLS